MGRGGEARTPMKRTPARGREPAAPSPAPAAPRSPSPPGSRSPTCCTPSERSCCARGRSLRTARAGDARRAERAGAAPHVTAATNGAGGRGHAGLPAARARPQRAESRGPRSASRRHAGLLCTSGAEQLYFILKTLGTNKWVKTNADINAPVLDSTKESNARLNANRRNTNCTTSREVRHVVLHAAQGAREGRAESRAQPGSALSPEVVLQDKSTAVSCRVTRKAVTRKTGLSTGAGLGQPTQPQGCGVLPRSHLRSRLWTGRRRTRPCTQSHISHRALSRTRLLLNSTSQPAAFRARAPGGRDLNKLWPTASSGRGTSSVGTEPEM